MDSLVDSHNELSVKNKEAERYFYMSFKFSQGSADLQSHLHQWAKINGYFDSVEDPPEIFLKS